MRAWNPWRALLERPEVQLVLDWLPEWTGGAAVRTGGRRPVVAVDRRALQVDRNAALAHELVHLERGLQAHASEMPGLWDAVRRRDEHAVNAEVAHRLVPMPELARLADQLADVGEGVEPWRVAEEFTVPWDVAVRALKQLVGWERSGQGAVQRQSFRETGDDRSWADDGGLDRDPARGLEPLAGHEDVDVPVADDLAD